MKEKSIWIVSDNSAHVIQATSLAQSIAALDSSYEIEEIDKLIIHEHHIHPDIVIGAGNKTAHRLLDIKARSGNKAFAVMILDPYEQHDNFDLIVLPSYEPHPEGDNIITTIGLLSYITPEYLATELSAYKEDNKYIELKNANLEPPYHVVLVGGRHATGDITTKNAIELSELINQAVGNVGGSIFITTSARTENSVTDILSEHIKAPSFLYDYKRHRQSANPYDAMLALANNIIVTGDSVRMISESCSSGKPVYIYQPKTDFSPYIALHDELYQGGYAKPFVGQLEKEEHLLTLSEVERTAKQILKTLSQQGR